MARAAELSTGAKHGDTCTCRPLDPITLTVQPVLAAPDCPGVSAERRNERIDGRVVITWPPPAALAVPGFGVEVSDADTGEQWTADVLNLRVCVDPRGVATAVLERLVDADGNPIGRGKAVPTEDGDGYRTALFRYAVGEMRVAEAR